MKCFRRSRDRARSIGVSRRAIADNFRTSPSFENPPYYFVHIPSTNLPSSAQVAFLLLCAWDIQELPTPPLAVHFGLDTSPASPETVESRAEARVVRELTMADSTSAASGAPPKQKRSFFKKPSWKQKVDNPDEDDPTAMFDGSKQTFSAVMEEQERARVKKLQEQEEKARRKELKAARQGKRRKIARDEEQYSDEDHVPATRGDGKK